MSDFSFIIERDIRIHHNVFSYSFVKKEIHQMDGFLLTNGDRGTRSPYLNPENPYFIGVSAIFQLKTFEDKKTFYEPLKF